MNENTYNGWTNYQTWVVKLWIDNEQHSQEYWLDRAAQCLKESEGDKDEARYNLSSELEIEHDECAPEVSGVFADLLQRSMGLVEWREIADSLLEYAAEILEDA
jgi:hypothetical protein